MTLAQLRTGEAVFVDANIFVFHFASDPKFQAACSQFLIAYQGSRATRPNDAGPVSALLRGEDSPAALLPALCCDCFTCPEPSFTSHLSSGSP
jgi:hypothetical protein